MSKLAFVTPETQPDGMQRICVTIPSGWEWSAIVRGALLILADSRNFENAIPGSVTPEYAAEQFYTGLQVTFDNWERECTEVVIGEHKWVYNSNGGNVPSNWLPCDGSNKSSAVYPELYAVIGNAYGGIPPFFNVPDLGFRMLVGQVKGSHVFGETGGEETHTLTIDELPTSIRRDGTNNIAAGSGTVSRVNTGGDQPHNNMPPYLVALPYIVADLP